MGALPTLYQLQASHRCEAARWILDAQARPYHVKSLLPGPHVAQLLALTRQTQVPALVAPGSVRAGLREVALGADTEGRLGVADALAEVEALDAALGSPLETVWLAAALSDPEYAATWLSLGRGPTRRFLYKQAFPAVRAALQRLVRLDEPHVASCRLTIDAGLERLASRSTDRLDFASIYAASCVSWLIPAPLGPHRIQLMAPPAVQALQAEWGEHPGVAWATRYYRAHRGVSMSENHEVQGSGVI